MTFSLLNVKDYCTQNKLTRKIKPECLDYNKVKNIIYYDLNVGDEAIIGLNCEYDSLPFVLFTKAKITKKEKNNYIGEPLLSEQGKKEIKGICRGFNNNSIQFTDEHIFKKL